MKGTLFSILVLCVVAGFAVVAGCTGSGSTASTENLGTVLDKVTLDGVYSKEEAKYFGDFEISKEFNNGEPIWDSVTGLDFVDTSVFVVGSDGVYFFEKTNGEVAKGFKNTEPGWMILQYPNNDNNYIKFDFYSDEAFWATSSKEFNKNKIPAERWYDIDSKIFIDEEGNVCVEGISKDPKLINAIYSMYSQSGRVPQITSNAGDWYANSFDDILMETQ